MNYLYLLIDIFTVIVPFGFSFHPKIKFYTRWKAFFPAAFITGVVFIIWDAIYTAKGIWGFNPRYITGVYFFHLPVEELMFFLCVPYASVFTYHCLTSFYKLQWKRKNETICALLLSSFLLITGFIFYSRLYTSVTFISLSMLILLLNFVFKVHWFGKLLTVYAVLLIPFFIVNGLLTGSCLQQPIVWYNPLQIIGVRIFTIPIEDFFYGFELISLNIAFYEYLNTCST